jgi:NADPH-dependent 2,4-dienoyl-CoA reductase/sulfur reductase-like enzyme
LLSGKKAVEKVFINNEAFYRENGIDLRLGTKITGIDAARKVLRTQSGEEIPYGKLVIATGARVRTLQLPGADLNGIHYLRSLRDCLSLRLAAEKAKRAVVIGGGFISMEVTSVLAEKGIATTMVFPGERVWKQFFTPEMSAFFEGYYEKRRVTLTRGVHVAGFGGKGCVEKVVLASGAEIGADLVVAGIGVEPFTDFLDGTGVKVDNGIVVNEFLETGVDSIYAAGDVANYTDTLFGKRRRPEHWDNAVSQGRHLASTLTGQRAPFVHVPYFFSDEFDLSYELWGDSAGADVVVHRGNVAEGSFSVWWLCEGRLTAAFVMNRPDEERDVAPNWIQEHRQVDAEALRDEKRLLSGL